MRLRGIRYGKVSLLCTTFLLIFLLFILSQFDIHTHRIGIVEGSFLHRNLDKLPVGLGQQFHQWVQKNAFNFKWEDIHCVKRDVNKTVVLFKKWAPFLAAQLNLKDGHSLFDSNIVCNEWFLAFNSTFHGLKFGGADVSKDVLGYSKRVFNKFEKNFILVNNMQNLEKVGDHQYDHILNYGGVTMLKDETEKCNIVKSLLTIVKPGGSIYIGHNVEKHLCKDSTFRDSALSPCFWNTCLQKRRDIYEIYYINETDLFGKDASLHDCYTGVFIHRKICISQPNCDEVPASKRYKQHPKMFYCKEGKAVRPKNLIQSAADIIKKSGIIRQKSLTDALQKFSEHSSNSNR